MPILSLYRGIPGCGKTTLANSEHESLPECVFAADDLFETPDGYQFDPSRLGEAHAVCARDAIRCAVRNGDAAITNTFINHWELIVPIELAWQAQVTVRVIEFVPVTVEQIVRAHARCQHGVPLDVVARMACEFKPWTGGACDITQISDW